MKKGEIKDIFFFFTKFNTMFDNFFFLIYKAYNGFNAILIWDIDSS